MSLAAGPSAPQARQHAARPLRPQRTCAAAHADHCLRAAHRARCEAPRAQQSSPAAWPALPPGAGAAPRPRPSAQSAPHWCCCVQCEAAQPRPLPLRAEQLTAAARRSVPCVSRRPQPRRAARPAARLRWRLMCAPASLPRAKPQQAPLVLCPGRTTLARAAPRAPQGSSLSLAAGPSAPQLFLRILPFGWLCQLRSLSIVVGDGRARL